MCDDGGVYGDGDGGGDSTARTNTGYVDAEGNSLFLPEMSSSQEIDCVNLRQFLLPHSKIRPAS